MKELILFSIRRRFFNSTTLLLNLLLCCIIGGAVFSDRILEAVNPGMMDSQVVYLKLDEPVALAIQAIEQDSLIFEMTTKESEELLEKNEKAYVLTYEDGYQLISKYQVSDVFIETMEAMLTTIHQTMALNELLTIEEISLIQETLHIENQVINDTVELNTDKQNLIFMLITSIYFTMLSFSTSVANELIYEKSTRQLELILTSVSAKTHFYSKMIVGWLGIILQFLSILLLGGIWLGIRHLYDEGKGLIQFVNHFQLIHFDQETIVEVFQNLPIESETIGKLLFILFFLMMGILLLQMILVVISSFIANIEEAGNIQGPFYLILLGIYYFAISMNTPYQMSEGVGYYCSFLPFLNMLFMPCRLLIQDVEMIELILSALISSVGMILILAKGPAIYQRGVLDYSSKGFLTVIKKTMFDGERTQHDRKKTKLFRKC